MFLQKQENRKMANKTANLVTFDGTLVDTVEVDEKIPPVEVQYKGRSFFLNQGYFTQSSEVEYKEHRVLKVG